MGRAAAVHPAFHIPIGIVGVGSSAWQLVGRIGAGIGIGHTGQPVTSVGISQGIHLGGGRTGTAQLLDVALAVVLEHFPAYASRHAALRKPVDGIVLVGFFGIQRPVTVVPFIPNDTITKTFYFSLLFSSFNLSIWNVLFFITF